jgi:hypothetical protein
LVPIDCCNEVVVEGFGGGGVVEDAAGAGVELEGDAVDSAADRTTRSVTLSPEGPPLARFMMGPVMGMLV